MTNRDRSKYLKDYNRKRLERGICRCGRPIQEGKTRCQRCRESASAKLRVRAAQRKAAGLCVVCGKAKEPTASKCESCRQVGVRWLQRLRAKVITAYGGVCR